MHFMRRTLFRRKHATARLWMYPTPPSRQLSAHVPPVSGEPRQRQPFERQGVAVPPLQHEPEKPFRRDWQHRDAVNRVTTPHGYSTCARNRRRWARSTLGLIDQATRPFVPTNVVDLTTDDPHQDPAREFSMELWMREYAAASAEERVMMMGGPEYVANRFDDDHSQVGISQVGNSQGYSQGNSHGNSQGTSHLPPAVPITLGQPTQPTQTPLATPARGSSLGNSHARSGSRGRRSTHGHPHPTLDAATAAPATAAFTTAAFTTTAPTATAQPMMAAPATAAFTTTHMA